MATGRLGAEALSAATNTTVYTVPADTFAVVTASICNRSGADITVRLALASADTPTNAEFLEYDTTLVGNGTLERTGIVADAGKKIVAYSSTSDASVVVYGIETSTATA